MAFDSKDGCRVVFDPEEGCRGVEMAGGLHSVKRGSILDDAMGDAEHPGERP